MWHTFILRVGHLWRQLHDPSRSVVSNFDIWQSDVWLRSFHQDTTDTAIDLRARHCFCQGGQRSHPDYEQLCRYTAQFVDKLSAVPECQPAHESECTLSTSSEQCLAWHASEAEPCGQVRQHWSPQAITSRSYTFCAYRQRLHSVSAVASSKRQAKDPRRYGSMDDMRAHLQQQTTGSGGLAGLLNWLSNSAFGATR